MTIKDSKTLPSDPEADSTRLATLVDDLLAQARAGSPVDIDRVAAEHPDLASELRELWAVAALAEEVGSESAVLSNGIDSNNAAHNSSPFYNRGRALPQ